MLYKFVPFIPLYFIRTEWIMVELIEFPGLCKSYAEAILVPLVDFFDHTDAIALMINHGVDKIELFQHSLIKLFGSLACNDDFDSKIAITQFNRIPVLSLFAPFDYLKHS